jgi:hypothetical protein
MYYQQNSSLGVGGRKGSASPFVGFDFIQTVQGEKEMPEFDAQGVVAQSQTDRPCYVEFENRPVEDNEASIEQGKYVAKDVAHVIITPAGGNLVVEKIAETWLSEKRIQRDPFTELYERKFDEWKKGNEIPEEGTAIKTWPVLTPGQIQVCLKANIRTVEDLSCANDSALRSIGMESRRMQRQAQAWLETASDVGKVSKKLDKLTVSVEDLTEENKDLRSKLEAANTQLDRLTTPVDKGASRKSSADAAKEKKSERDDDPEM